MGPRYSNSALHMKELWGMDLFKEEFLGKPKDNKGE